jgi:hypothetical protein
VKIFKNLAVLLVKCGAREEFIHPTKKNSYFCNKKRGVSQFIVKNKMERKVGA